MHECRRWSAETVDRGGWRWAGGRRGAGGAARQMGARFSHLATSASQRRARIRARRIALGMKGGERGEAGGSNVRPRAAE